MQRKIIFSVTNDLNYDQRMIRICNTLAAASYQVHLVGRELPQSLPLVERNFAQHRIRCWFNKGKLFYLEYNFRLLIYFFFHEFDAIGSVDLDTLVPGYLASRWKQKPLVFDAHEYFTEVPEVVGRPFVQGIWQKVAQLILPRITHAYTVCESLAEIFEELYGTAFEVIRNVPFARERSALIPKHEPPIILYQGVLNEGRGLEQAIEAMRSIEGAQLWLAGEGDLSSALRQQVLEMQLSEKVLFLGYVRPDELKEITAQATIGLNLLANKGLSYYYSLANKSFDYIQAGVPAIHMDFPEYQKLNNTYEIGLLLTELSAEAVAQLIEKLLSDPNLYQQLQQNCAKAAEELTWENESLTLLQLYDRIWQ